MRNSLANINICNVVSEEIPFKEIVNDRQTDGDHQADHKAHCDRLSQQLITPQIVSNTLSGC